MPTTQGRKEAAFRRLVYAPGLRAQEAGVEAAGDGGIRGSLDDGAPVGKEGDLVLVRPELQHEVGVSHFAVWPQRSIESGKVHGPLLLMDLDRVSSAQSDPRTLLSSQMHKVALAAAAASSLRLVGLHLRMSVRPNVPTEKRAAQRCARAVDLVQQDLHRLGHGDGRDQVDDRSQYPRRLAGVVHARGGLRKKTSKAGRLAGQDIHG